MGGVLFVGLIFAVFSAVSIPLVLCFIPQKIIETDSRAERVSYLSLMTFSRVVTLLSLMFNIMLLCIMPIYGSYKLGQQGWGLTPLQISGVIGIGTATMLVGSVPIGILADRYSKNERVLKGIQALGFAGFAVSYIIAGPAQLPG